MAAPHILVVDDDESVRTVTQEMLLRLGYTASSVNSGVDALSIMLEEQFDVVLLDLAMPHMTGEEVFAEMQQRRSSLPVVFMTGVASEEVALIADAAQTPTSVLSKPFPMRTLETTLEDILAG